MRIHIGCSGWFYWHWRGILYPADEPTHRWFKHYLAAFRTVELNAPFYRWPRDSTVKGWRRTAKGRFRYSVKVNGAITHERRFVGTRTLIRQFYALADILGPRLGCLLFQLPPSYHYSPARLRAIVSQLDPAYRNVVEFRHKTWWRPNVYRAFEKAGLIFCAVSGPRLPEDLIKTNEVLYVRFHGRPRWYRHDYSRAELAGWAEKIKASGAAEAWIYFNNDREGFALKNARTLRRLLRQPRRAKTPAAAEQPH